MNLPTKRHLLDIQQNASRIEDKVTNKKNEVSWKQFAITYLNIGLSDNFKSNYILH